MEVQSTVSSAEIQSEDDQAGEVESEEDPLNWQRLVSRDVLASLTSKEIKRQEVINGEPTELVSADLPNINKTEPKLIY